MEKKNRCSHKAIEWREYKKNKKKGDGNFSPSDFCIECDTSIKLKSSRPNPTH